MSAGGFQVPTWMHLGSGFVERFQPLMVRLASLETRVLRERLEERPVQSPIYVSGLARAGTTILLEVLASHPEVGSHQYRDFPFVHLPYAWTWLLRYAETRESAPAERAHGDRILVTARSPEAMEEVVWRTFFPQGDPAGGGDVLAGGTSHPEFERFYRAHVGKVLLARESRRYLAKGNYNVTRLAYLHRIFPDARFLLPVRAPAGHVASLLRQQRRFTAGTVDNPRGRAHLRRVGHFEFGPDRRAIVVDAAGAASVRRLWERGEEVRGWARYWSLMYGFLAEQRAREPEVAAASRIVRFEDLCADPRGELKAILAHAGLEETPALLETYAHRIKAPDYYDPGLSPDDRAVIREETAAVAARYGY